MSKLINFYPLPITTYSIDRDECSESQGRPIRERVIPPQNVINRLIRREMFGERRPGTRSHVARSFHLNVFPNFTIINVEKPPCFLRKFSPDGQHFVAFSSDQTSLEVYEYRGCSAAADLIRECEGEYIGHREGEERSDQIRAEVFDRFFKPKWVVNVARSGEQLNRECSLFTDDGRYVIVGSAAYVPEELRPHFYEIYTNNEAVTPNPRSPLEDYTLSVVDLHCGKLCDTRRFKVDKIFLSHNQGVYLYRDTLAVLSVQHQTIHIFLIVDGLFFNVRKIGRFCFEDDHFLLSSVVPTTATGTNSTYRPFREETINSLKHRLLVFLYKRAKAISEATGDPLEMRKFCQHFDHLKSLRIWKMQLLDESHLLLKYACEDVVTLKATEPNSQPSFFVVYNMLSAQVLAVYENTSEELLLLFENFCDHFRNARFNLDRQVTCSPSNNLYARLAQRRFKQTMVSARFGGPTEATKRMLAQLPISAQSYTGSPYLDLSLFSYDDKWISVMERPKACGEHPIRFYGRNSGLLKFRINAGLVGKSVPPAARRLVAFTFHPTDPFAISVQRTNAEYVVNFHIRHCPS